MERQKEQDLAGKVAIVTGASRGIGKEAALSLARRGVNVVVTARTVEPGTELPGTIGETLKQIEAMGAEAIAVAADLALEEDLKRLVDTTVERFGGVDILVNNAAATTGSFWSTPFAELTREDWLYQFAVNVHAPFTLTQLVVPIMEERGGGRIINVTTGSGEALRLTEEPLKRKAVGSFSLIQPGYYSSKRAMDRFANVMAPEFADKNIWIISVLPGFVATEIMELRVKNSGMNPSGAVPMSVPARMVAYFASCEDPAEYTGRIFWAEREMADMGIETD